MRGPFPTVTLLYVFGVLLGAYTSFQVFWLFGIALTISAAALTIGNVRPILLWPACILLGWVSISSRTAILSPDDLRNVVGDKIEYVRVQGTLSRAPIYRAVDNDSKLVFRSIAQIDVSAIRTGASDQWAAAYGKVAASTPGMLDASFVAGQPIEVQGILRMPPQAAAEGLFDYRAYLKSHGIYYQFSVESSNDWLLIAPTNCLRAPPLSHRFSKWAQATLAKGLPGDDEPLQLLHAMALGWKTGLTDEVAEPFMQSGTLHVFAISGLHVALIAGILVSLLRVLQVPRSTCGFVVIPLLWFYTASTGWQASAIRSTIMMSVVIAGWSLRRPSNLLNTLAASSFIILLWEPRQLFQASFQLSFFVVLSIAIFLPPLERVRQRLVQTDPFLPPDLRPRWQRWLDDPLHYITASAATSMAAWLGSLPLIAYYFHLVTPVSLIANLVIVPLSGFGLMSCLGSLICGDWLSTCTVLFNHSAWFWMSCMIQVSHWAAALPGAYFYVPGPGIVGFAVYYLLLVAVLSGWIFAMAWRRWAGSAFCVGIAAWWLIQHWNEANHSIQITVPPLGGSGLYCDAPGRDNDLLIDCGSTSAAEYVLKPFLRARGVEVIPNVLLTHGDLQHVGGFEFLAKQFAIGQVTTSSVRFRSGAYRKIVERLAQEPGRWRRVQRGDRIGSWTVLHPDPSDRFSVADDSTVVLYGEFFGIRVLLLSDLGKFGQRKLLEREPDLKTDVVISGLPTNGEPLERALLESLQPRLVVIASAEYPAGSRTSRELRTRLDECGVPVVYTTETGAATLTLRQGHWSVRTMSGLNFEATLAKHE